MSLKITEIEYSELKTGSGYDNKKVGIKCSVAVDENPDEVLQKAKEYVQEKLNSDEISKIESMIKDLEDKRRELFGDINLMKKFLESKKEVSIFLSRANKIQEVLREISNSNYYCKNSFDDDDFLEYIKSSEEDNINDDIPPF